MIYLFDGSYAGFLCCVFESFERKEFHAIPLTEPRYQEHLFQEKRDIISDPNKAKRVQEGLRKHLGIKAADFFKVFLAEMPQAWHSSMKLIQQLFKQGGDILHNYGNPDVLFFSQTLKKVSRERHRMKAFIRFQKSSNGLYYAIIAPDFNVLPLISEFFRKRYADQPWLIYDEKRKYGVHYDLTRLSEVEFTQAGQQELVSTATTLTVDAREEAFQVLWKQYYNSTNIAARKNLKLHLKHVPKRYWKYLVEKK